MQSHIFGPDILIFLALKGRKLRCVDSLENIYGTIRITQLRDAAAFQSNPALQSESGSLPSQSPLLFSPVPLVVTWLFMWTHIPEVLRSDLCWGSPIFPNLNHINIAQASCYKLNLNNVIFFLNLYFSYVDQS